MVFLFQETLSDVQSGLQFFKRKSELYKKM